jgi:hypothetical protein
MFKVNNFIAKILNFVLLTTWYGKNGRGHPSNKTILFCEGTAP